MIRVNMTMSCNVFYDNKPIDSGKQIRLKIIMRNESQLLVFEEKYLFLCKNNSIPK